MRKISILRRVAGRLFHSEQPQPRRLPALPFATVDDAVRYTEQQLANRKASRPLRSEAAARGHQARRARRHDPLLAQDR